MDVSGFMLVGSHVHVDTVPRLSVLGNLIYISKGNSLFFIIDWVKIVVLH